MNHHISIYYWKFLHLLPLVLLESALGTGPSSLAAGHLKIYLSKLECLQEHGEYTTAEKKRHRYCMCDVFAPFKCVYIDFTLDPQHDLNSLYWLWTCLGVWWCPAVSWTGWPFPPLSRSGSCRLYLYADIQQQSLSQLPFDTYLGQWPVHHVVKH